MTDNESDLLIRIEELYDDLNIVHEALRIDAHSVGLERLRDLLLDTINHLEDKTKWKSYRHNGR